MRNSGTTETKTLLVTGVAGGSLSHTTSPSRLLPGPALTRTPCSCLLYTSRVWEAYRELARNEPERVRIVDGRADLDTIERAVWEIVTVSYTHLPRWRITPA